MQTDSDIWAEISVYPLRQARLGPSVEATVEALRAAGLNPVVGAMSTVVHGDRRKLFPALDRAFQAASTTGDVVMSVRVSNACKG